MLEYLSLDIIYSSKLAFAVELLDLARKTVCFSEETMSADKYPTLKSFKYFRSHAIGLNAPHN